MKNKIRLFILIVVFYYIFVFLVFYPHFYGSPDAHHYLRSAFLIKSSNLVVSGPLYSFGNHFNGIGFVSKYNIGASFLYLPFILLGWKFAFLSSLFLHLIGFFFFWKIIKELDYPEIYSLFYLLFPPLTYYSRVLLSEIASITFIIAAAYFYLKDSQRSNVIAGLLFGFSILIRYTNVFIAISFLLVSFFIKRRKFYSLVLGMIPFIIILLLTNDYLYGGIFSTGYSLSGETLLFFSKIPYRIILYSIALSILYPGMMLALLFYRNKLRLEFLISFVTLLLFYSAVHISGFQFRLLDLLIATRYLAPLFPFFIIAYIPFYRKMISLSRFSLRWTTIIAVLGLILILPFTFAIHNNFLYGRFEIMESLAENIPPNSTVLGVDDDYMFFMEDFHSLKFVDIENASINGGMVHFSIKGKYMFEDDYPINNDTYLLYIEGMRSKDIEDTRFERDYSKVFAILEMGNSSLVYYKDSYYDIYIYKII
ncbi:MAG: hypothetical protein V1740_06420 [Candidatus Woesearchaeota archaeon]